MRILREEKGQALIYVALSAMVLVGLVYWVYDSSRLLSAKIQSQNAADAAALAAVSLKVSVHNTRTLAYLAMTQQAGIARIEMLKALAALGDTPPGTGVNPGYQAHLQNAQEATRRLKRLRAALVAYNSWIQAEGPQMVTEAAHLGYAANIGGINDVTPFGKAAETKNLTLLSSPGDLRENRLGDSLMLGGTNYAAEGVGGHGNSGKSYVEVDPAFSPLGLKMMKYQGGDEGLFSLHARAAAAPVPMKIGIKGFELDWYVPRLFRTGKKHGEDYEPLH